tara:strand:- start:5205 stop:5606 length:402 start_codon:yes stop_codon:yes gene_type:complete
MFFNIIYTTIVSIIIIFVVHNIFNYLKNTLTSPKIKDLINKPKYEYNKINNLINSNDDNIMFSNVINKENTEKTENCEINSHKNNIIDSEQIKSELKDFFKELNNNIPNDNNITNDNIYDYQSYNDNNVSMNF